MAIAWAIGWARKVSLSSLVTRVAPSLMGGRRSAAARNFDAVQQSQGQLVKNQKTIGRTMKMRVWSGSVCGRCVRLSDAIRLRRRYGP
jgi:hypothetical protein